MTKLIDPMLNADAQISERLTRALVAAILLQPAYANLMTYSTHSAATGADEDMEPLAKAAIESAVIIADMLLTEIDSEAERKPDFESLGATGAKPVGKPEPKPDDLKPDAL